MWLDEFRRLQAVIARARVPGDVFPSLASADGDRRAALDEDYRRLARLANPGPGVGNAETRNAAEELLVRLNRLYRAAVAELDANAPGDDAEEDPRATASLASDREDPSPIAPIAPLGGAPARAISPPMTAISMDPAARPSVSFAVDTPLGRYEATSVLAEGDIATVWLGFSVMDNAEVVVKIARDPADNDLMLDEARTLRLFAQAGAPQLKQLPALIDQFRTGDGRAGAVLGRAPGHDLVAIRERYTSGVPPEHAIWILRRLLSVVGFAHSQGVLHGNIEPSHVIVSPDDHNVTLIDWGYSLVAPLRPGQGWKVHNPDYSAPEISEKKPPIPPSDLYSVGRCAIMLLGGDLESNALPDTIDERLARFVLHFVRESPLQRAQDAWESFAQLKKLREEIYGPHKFRVFEM